MLSYCVLDEGQNGGTYVARRGVRAPFEMRNGNIVSLPRYAEKRKPVIERQLIENIISAEIGWRKRLPMARHLIHIGGSHYCLNQEIVSSYGAF